MIDIVLCATIASAALFLRTWYAWKSVFTQTFVRFGETDAWYHMRVVDYVVARFPRFPAFDPYLVFPTGGEPPVAPLFSIGIATAVRLFGGAHPSPRLVETVGALTPAVLGAITVIPIYTCARRLWSRGAAIIGSLLIAMMPGEFMTRSMLGYVDHHVAETLLSSCCVLFLVMAYRSEQSRVRWSIASGIALAAYLLTWRSGAMLLAIIFAASAAAIVIAAAFHDDAAPAVRCTLVAFGTAAILVLPSAPYWRRGAEDAAALVAGCAAIALIGFAAARFRDRERAGLWVAGSIAAAAVVGIAVLGFTASSFLKSSLQDLHRMNPGRKELLVSEAIPLLRSPRGMLFLFDEFGIAGYLAIGGLIVLFDRIRRDGKAEDVLLALYSLAMFVATLAQIRFAYYLAATVAILCAFFWRALMESEPALRRRIVAVVIVIAGVFAPIAPRALAKAKFTAGPSTAWNDALLWMRSNTPEPFATPDAYTDDSARKPAYGVLAWWDFGYWIERIAHRVPVTNPTQANAAEVARALMSTDEGELDAMARQLGARYLILDEAVGIVKPVPGVPAYGGYIKAMCGWTGQDCNRFLETVEITRPDGQTQEVMLFYPDYFRLVGIRMFQWGPERVEPAESWVASFAPPREPGRVRRLVSIRRFIRYDEAAKYAGEAPDRRIVAVDPLKTCVPLDALSRYRLVYTSPYVTASAGLPAIRIYESAR